MSKRFAIGQTKSGQGWMVMERQMVGERDVYVEFATVADVARAGEIVAALNSADTPPEPPEPPSGPLYAGAGLMTGADADIERYGICTRCRAPMIVIEQSGATGLVCSATPAHGQDFADDEEED